MKKIGIVFMVVLLSLCKIHALPDQQIESQETTAFTQQAKELGFTDQEITAVLEQAKTRGITSEDITEFLNTVLKQKESADPASVEAQKPSFLYYAAVIGGGVLAVWLLYQLYEMIRIKNIHEVKVKADPIDGLSEEEIQEAEDQISRALRNNGNAKKVVIDLAAANPGVRVKAHWRHQGANRNITVAM